jgi:hypothetical protein
VRKIFSFGGGTMTTEERYAHWQEVFETQKTSGLSIAEYCRKQNIRSSYYYAWRCRIRKRQMVNHGFIELSPSGSVSAGGIRILTATGFHIEVNRGFDPSTLRSVLACLASR